MTPRACMIDAMAASIGRNETHKGDRLNDAAIRDRKKQ